MEWLGLGCMTKKKQYKMERITNKLFVSCMEKQIADSFVKKCSNCGSRNACCDINDDLKPCEYWYYGNGYGSSISMKER